MSTSKKVIVTGITGQDGSYMVDYLLENTSHEIFGMVRRSSNLNTVNISHFLDNPRVKLVTGDLSDSQSIDSLVKEIKPDYFINLAAQSFVGSSWQIPEQTFEIGAVGVIRCLEAIRKHYPSCRFYNAGSSEELGDVDYSPQNEKHPLKPRSPYGAAKAAARHIVKVYRESYNLYAIQGLLYNHESERRGVEFVTRKITKGVARIKHSLDNNIPFAPLELGNIDAKRDWSHAADFVDGIWKMLNQDQPKEYILSSGETHTVREFIEIAFSEAGINGAWQGEGINETLIGKDESVLVKINPEFYRPAEVDLLWGDSKQARISLTWLPKILFRDLVSRMVKNDILLVNTYK
jgi:GDPmannose 4,6-dehydratase